jgi:cytidine deaminase
VTSIDGAALDELVSAAREVRGRAYAPYSGFHVGAAVLMRGDRVFAAVNVENASYPVSVCAERNAIGMAIAAGETAAHAVAVVSDSAVPTPPCGACRQVLFEFGGPGMAVIAESIDGSARTVWSLDELLPDAFGPADLDRSSP